MPYGSQLLELYGYNNVFIDPNTASPLYNQAVYFDTSGNEWVQGTGPNPDLVATSSNVVGSAAANIAEVNQQLAAVGLAAPQQITTMITANTGVTSNGTTFSLPSILQQQFLGVPAWVWLVGVGGLFLMMGKGSSRSY